MPPARWKTKCTQGPGTLYNGVVGRNADKSPQAGNPLATWRWKRGDEQSCHWRLEGQGELPSGSATLRVKFYTNGTLYVEASNDDALTCLQTALGEVAKAPLSLTSPVASKKSGNILSPNADALLRGFVTPYCGSDESGKGDYFGPLVVAGVAYRTEEEQNALAKLGVRDCKTLTDAQIIPLANAIQQTLGPKGVVIKLWENTVYNDAIAAGKRKGESLNHLMARSHAEVLSRLWQENPECTTWVVDRFAANTIVEKTIAQVCPAFGKHGETLIEIPKAEAIPAVAAASVMARAAFIQAMADLSQQVGMTLPKGAGSGVELAAKKLVLLHGPEVLHRVAKTHFQTTQRVL
ncbi:MAG: ribonuclease HIII [Vampirovibrionales bacterium]|nr:ribonuclease HIII [Vampirovibrionales bacterium]